MSNDLSKEEVDGLGKVVHARLPKGYGFVVLSFPMGTKNPRAQYVSNAQREDAVKVLKELLFRWGVDDQWMKDIP